MKKIFILLLIILTQGCSPRGYWTANNVYRAKKPNYKLAEIPFVMSDKIDTDYMYLSEASPVSNDTRPNNEMMMVSAIGFFDDGRAMLNGYEYEKRYEENLKRNSWETGQEVGYYRVDGNKIQFERLSPFDAGIYIKRNGIIKGDTIFMDTRYKAKKTIYIKSDLPIKH